MIKFLDLQKVNAYYRDEIGKAMTAVLDSGWYLQGEQVRRFERSYAEYVGTRYCVGCGNGLDALTLIYRAYIELGLMQPGDEVIVPANTYIATILALTENHLVPVLVEPDPATLELDFLQMQRHLTSRTRSVLLVHLYGRCAYTQQMGQWCDDHHLFLVEDNAQAHGCRTADGRRTGSVGHAAGHSFYPGKNMGALGDAGAVTTDNELLATTVRALANYGSGRKYEFLYRGRNSRLDELQAAVLSAKLPHLDTDNERRRRVADIYIREIRQKSIVLPTTLPAEQNVFHLFPVFCHHRDELQAFLKEHGVETLIHYPIPPHQQACFREWHSKQLPITEKIHQQELSLPMSQVLTSGEAREVVRLVNQFQELCPV